MTADSLKAYKIILASASPRRRQLLREAGLIFETAAVEYDEVWPSHLSGKEIAQYLAEGKADAWNRVLAPNEILITADTVVWCRDSLLGKPADAAEAAYFLHLLSGCDHNVITAICLRNQTRKHTFSVSTKVTFKDLSDDEISYYVENYQPYDKAGAYGIQEWIGLRGITRIEGSYYNVVGMPVNELFTELLHFISK
ncbi:MAG: Maf family nucleotide pyrophosphatase [Bacteroidales bacterium]|jgi:septum formation protein|nr:Maf family nucleotide pyrophosphatase [Bacteroidales bacterium]